MSTFISNHNDGGPVAPDRTRRLGARTGIRAAALPAVLALALAACGGSGDDESDRTSEGSGGDSGSQEQVDLRFTWWGSDTRHQITQEVIDAFEAEYPHISVQGEFGEWSGYWDKLATTVAANDAPDIIQMDEMYLREYAGRGALLDLHTLDGVDISAFEEATVATGEFDGGLYGLSSGVNSFAILANPSIFTDAGLDLPDDETWTWEEFKELSVQITENTDDGVWGSQSFGNEQAAFTTWARQHGESLFTADGEVGFSEATLMSFFEHMTDLRDAGAVPPASVTAEENSAGLDQGVTATNRVAMGFMWSNQLFAASEASGHELVLLRMPSQTGQASDNGAYYKSSMFWSVSSRTEHPEEAGLFVDFLANHAGDILLAERGVPPNTEVRTEVADQFNPAEAAAATFIQDIGDEIAEAPAPPPVGGASVQEIFQRHCAEVLFDRMSPEDAASSLSSEISSAVSR
ncbi:sugar ABC transporter substrate-binding protein [Phytoactinopolyspora alkaliphila]|uniref:Sugar ABC transporter substrate-binding protein n=1 Tax=Phytoactinopolyspora alkaliphila TaxID=1783498 RepID=A0A6N9YPQ0_9ACTN|nr:sugar ABC transporter substrate-binding protein [Phytoactinopolyspora alkaliphila]NED96983.1 sugar ABC transporter substrate-binding protein [Phytoactinopolyspora alkaliphila]